MSDKPMSPSRAIIVLNDLNTDGRIEVNRDELRAVVKTAQEALQRTVPQKPTIPYRSEIKDYVDGYCPSCFARQAFGSLGWHKIFNRFCNQCGQALNWSDN